MRELIGQTIDRYHIVKKLGRGGMATVYRAHDTRLERDVAIKFIRPDVVHDETFLKRFDREAKALAKLSHPYIVKVLDYGDFEGMPYLVMEYLPGETLKQKLGHPLDWTEAARMLIPVARSLDYIHDNNIVHRDVKPSNFLVSGSGELMLSDFGIAKMIHSKDTLQLTGTGLGIGTPEYMAPEQGMGKPVDGRADIYSLGVVFYEMITGKKPYTADTPMAVMYKQISDPLPSPRESVPELPEHVERVIFKAMAKNPEDRYQDMEEFIKVLENLVHRPESFQAEAPVFVNGETWGSGKTQAESTPVRRATKKSGSKVWLWVLGLLFVACIVVVIAVGGFGYLLSIFGSDPEGLQASVDIPREVHEDEEFEITIELRNEGDKNLVIEQIQLPTEFLDGAAVEKIIPSASGKHDYGDRTGYDFDLTLVPGEDTFVTFQMEGRNEGSYSGDIQIVVGTHRKVIASELNVEEAVAVVLPSSTPTEIERPTNTPIVVSASETPEITATVNSGVTTPQGGVSTGYDLLVAEDDFSDPESGWYISSDNEVMYDYLNGEYVIEVYEAGWIFWTYLGESYSDYEMQIDIHRIAGPGTSAYGIIGRYQDAGYYSFKISEDGYYSIFRTDEDDYELLIEWTYNDYLLSKDTYRMTVRCEGSLLSMRIDDMIYVETIDNTYMFGDVGVFAETFDDGTTTVGFDNYELYLPTE